MNLRGVDMLELQNNTLNNMRVLHKASHLNTLVVNKFWKKGGTLKAKYTLKKTKIAD